MNRTAKNVITIIIAVVMCVAITFTAISATNEMNSSTSPDTNQQNTSAPSMPDNTSKDSQNNQNSNQPPEKPQGESTSNEQNSDSSNQPPSKPDEQSEESSSEPPAKPEDNSSSTSEDQSKSSANNQNSESKSQDQGQAGEPPQMQAPSQTQSKTSDVPVKYLVALSFEGLILGLVLAYLFASAFNKRKFGETFKNKSNVAVVILTGALMASLCGFGGNFALEKITSTQQQEQGAPSGGGQQSQNVAYSATKEITSDEEVGPETVESNSADENAILASGEINASMSGTNINKTGDSDGGDATSFYGNNSAITAKDGASLDVSNATITTDATGANGVFSYGGSATTQNASGDGTTINISNSKITTSKDNSGGIMTTGGGVMNASKLTVNTAGTSSAAIRTDRGGGTVKVDGGNYTTTGKGSPAVYSTADVTIKNATLDSKTSEGVCIEGKNSVSLENVELSDSNTQLNGQSTTYKNIFLYQSMSGDADSGTSKFSAKNSKITTNKGDTLYVTNTTAEFDLENNEMTNTDSEGNFLRVQADSWGKSGSNGGDVTLNMRNQSAAGNIVIDSISTLKLNLTSGSALKSAINSDNTAKSIELKLSSDSKLTLTGDSYVTSLENEDSTNSNIDFNGHTLYVNGVALN